MPSMHSLVVETTSIEQEKREHFAHSEQKTKTDPHPIRHFGFVDEDNPVKIPVVSTDFIMQTPPHPTVLSQQKATTDPGIPPLPSGRYKKHPSDPTRNNPQLATVSRSSSLSRSKSCGEGRSSEPSDALDVLSGKPSTERLGSGAPLIDKSAQDSTGDCRDDGFEPPKASTAGNFKCTAFCVYLPGFSSKKKPELVPSQSHSTSNSVRGDNTYRDNFYKPDLGPNATPAARPSVISKVASMERFNLSSVSSDIVIDCWDDRGSSYFDLPMELISSSENETDSPVKAAFVFENERRGARHRKNSSSARMAFSKTSHEILSRRSNNSRISGSAKVSDVSSVRSSRSSVCNATKIMKAREELTAFVETQTG